MFGQVSRQLRLAAPAACATGALFEGRRRSESESTGRSAFLKLAPAPPAPIRCEGWFGAAKAKGPYSVSYFDIPALGEAVRLMFVLGKLEFEDVRPTFPEWREMKAGTKWGQLPLMRTPEGKECAQTKSIVRYLGKIVKVDGKKLYPDDLSAAFDVDEIIDAFEDLRLLFIPTMRMKTEDEKKEARVAIMAPGGPGDVLLKKLDAAATSSKYMVGASLTIADVWCFMFLNFLRCGFWDYIETDFLTKYPKLDAIQKNVKAHPSVKEYYSKVDLNAKPTYKFFVQP